MRKSRLMSLWTLSSDDSRVTELECHPGRSLWRLIGSIAILALAIALVACGDDSGTSANDDNVSSSSVIQSGDSHEGSSNSKKDGGSRSTSSGQAPSAMTSSSSSSAKAKSSSSVIQSSSRHSGLDPESSNSKRSSSSSKGIATNSSSSRNDVKSSSSVIQSSSRHSGLDPESSSGKKDGGSESAMTESSSSEYVPFDHSKTHAASWEIGENRYKTFVDPRNGRSYYYITITSSKTGKSVTVMAENLNIGEMVLGENNQNDDTKIERYCYNNDTTKCDEFGGLYQWAEMMQLPSRCNTESCADLIQENHRGICPEGWRLFTWDDYVVVRGYEDKYNDGVKGLRSTYGFRGTNQSGFSLTGAGRRTVGGKFLDLKETVFWFYPQEHEYGISVYAYAAYVSASSDDGTGTSSTRRAEKQTGRSVRCVKLE